MKKILALLLALTFALCLTSCETKENDNGSLGSQVASNETISSENDASTNTSSAELVKLNPKTDFEFGRYIAEYYANNNQSYHVISIIFHQDFNGFDYQKNNFYTIEYCKKKYDEWKIEFNEETFYEESTVIDGVTYYSIGDWAALPGTYQITDTEIKVSTDNENWSSFSLNEDGTLTLETVTDESYGTSGTVYSFGDEK